MYEHTNNANHMRHLISILAPVFVTAMSLISCNKPATTTPEEPEVDETSGIYIYGAATTAGLNLEMMEAFTETSGLYSWEGYLKAGLPFKFPTQKTSEWPAYMVDEDGETLVYGTSDDDLVIYTVEVDGTYEITIDTRDKNNPICLIDLISPDLTKVEFNELYLLGDATSAGWSLAAMEQFEKSGDTFTWEGPLKANLRFRFPLQKDPGTTVDDAKWWPCLCCHEGGILKYAMADDDESNVPVEEDGVYKIVVDVADRSNMTYTITLKESGLPDPEITNIWILGDAAPGGWALDLMPEMENNDGIFTWTGQLKSSGNFRFNTTNLNWFPAIVKEKATGKTVYCENWDDTVYEMFSVAQTGEYKVTVNAKVFDDITVTIELQGEVTPPSEPEITELYILGDGTDNGWALDTMPAFTNENGIFTWQGNLKASGGVRFPLQKTANVWWPCLCIQTSTGKLVKTTDADWNTGEYQHLTVAEDGVYKIVVNCQKADDISYTITKI